MAYIKRIMTFDEFVKDKLQSSETFKGIAEFTCLVVADRINELEKGLDNEVYYAKVKLFLNFEDSKVNRNDIDYVIYELDSSYNENKIKTANKDFSITFWAYGNFVVGVNIFLKNGVRIYFKHKMNLYFTENEYKKNGESKW